jgi:hypothetical protein
VRPGKAGSVKLMLLPIKTHPELLDGASAALSRRRTGDALIELRPGDEGLLGELREIVARAFAVYTEAE